MERVLPGMAGTHVEFPTINNNYAGRRTRFGYAAVSLDDPSRPAHMIGAVKVRAVPCATASAFVHAVVSGCGRRGGCWFVPVWPRCL